MTNFWCDLGHTVKWKDCSFHFSFSSHSLESRCDVKSSHFGATKWSLVLMKRKGSVSSLGHNYFCCFAIGFSFLKLQNIILLKQLLGEPQKLGLSNNTYIFQLCGGPCLALLDLLVVGYYVFLTFEGNS
jgi:hypothetical protein